jgi:hypothetical protein
MASHITVADILGQMLYREAQMGFVGHEMDLSAMIVNYINDPRF